MKEYHPKAGLQSLCRLFGASRQAWYKLQARQDDTTLQQALILDMVKQIRSIMPRIGCDKLRFMLKEELSSHHIRIGRDGFRNLLKSHNMLVKGRKRYYVRTTDSNHPFRKWPDLRGTIMLTGPGQLWVSDITYLRTKEDGFLYLSLITDSYSRKIVGHHLSHSLKAKGCISALSSALKQLPEGGLGGPLIHHSDRGFQYCCPQYVTMLTENRIAISMTEKSSPYENPLAERINGILKTELGISEVFKDYGAALMAVSSAISIYNNIRPHKSWDMLTPGLVHSLPPDPKIQPINPKQLSKQSARKPKSVVL